MKIIKINEKRILALLAEKQSYAKRNLEIIKQMGDLETEFNTVTGKVKRTDEKVRPLIMKELKKITLGEYEELSRVATDEKTGDWFMDINDRLEEFKTNFKKRK